ncbi:ferredoxin-type protein NapF [Arcobacter porcinus]|uniref:Ferredoxin-type protein n=1 Tax=Arcobacter porcinus TaxID=1935204 RepID=A0A1C0AYT6_9BACT|nr:ferredoxin-type protein NapF [Arcobacter porcinus]OCL94318.1 ferredoxin-type protein [Aliarcobacter thereius]OCL81547.1 ferredoxin-type protein [Arcobacter porcinus]OCL83480.1 ferredoxin-type protein [Arcobacter porcinus]OCL92693.1 ferredoxin-type protein [Arcobacter porcinus]QEP41333.1 ferredoxin-type protein [Arcobacter porcinus]
MDRRELFSSLSKSFRNESRKIKRVRPPYFIDENIFFTNCINCSTKDCITACEENIILLDDDQTIFLDFSKSGCTYCDLCANACTNSVLKIEDKTKIDAKFEIDILSCLSWQNTMCFSCKDPCLDNAIDFLGVFRPSINDNCTSCGFCLKVCPSGAIKIK